MCCAVVCKCAGGGCNVNGAVAVMQTKRSADYAIHAHSKESNIFVCVHEGVSPLVRKGDTMYIAW